jgi:hypothetical protein
MRRALLVIGFFSAVNVLSAADVPPSSSAPAPSTAQLIEKLADRDYHVREAASKALAARDTDALPALIKARQNADPEVRRRLEELIPVLERRAALTPKRVTLHMTARPLKDAFAELSRQTGYKIGAWPNDRFNEDDRHLFTFNFDKLPFWQAMDQVCEAGGLILQQTYWGDDSLRVYSQDSYVPFAHYNGPFRVVATGFTYSRNNQFGQLARNPMPMNGAMQFGAMQNEFLQLGLTIAVEPKLPILRAGQVRLLVAEDEERRSMIPSPNNAATDAMNRRGYYGGGGFRAFVYPIQVALTLPSKNDRWVKTIRGTIPVTVLSEQKPAIVTERLLASKGKKFKVGNSVFSIEEISEMPGKQYQFRISVTEENKGGGNDYTQVQTLQQRLEIQDDKGLKRPMFLSNINYSGPGAAQLQFTLQPPAAGAGNPTRLIYYAWETLEHEVEFEFHDLPLP